ELHAMAVPGVTLHVSRIHVPAPDLSSDEATARLVEHVRENTRQAIAQLMGAEPDHLLMGISIETIWDGPEGNRLFKEQVREWTGLPVTTAADAIERALRLLGVKRIGLVTPYRPKGNQRLARFFGA